MDIRTINFQKRQNDTGCLAFLEAQRDIPFEIKRVYYIFNVAPGARRGFHAHKKLKQVLLCINGSCKILLDDGKEKKTVELNDPTQGLLLEGTVWREMFDFSADAVLLVFASDYYDENDYIRNYNDFLKYIREDCK